MSPRTRSQLDSASQHLARGLARKRRSSIDDDHDDKPEERQSQLPVATEDSAATPTPRKVVKRVRFSDLGPELASTGLTPSVRRATLSPSASAQTPGSAAPARRRRSLPPSLPSSTAEQSPTVVERIQFTPLRQVLDSRIRRRLRRNHLSEEINDFQAEQRALNRAQSELTQLRSQEEQRQETIRRLTLDLELQRQLGIEVNVDEEQRMQDLQRELADWKAQAEKIKTEYHESVDLVDTALELPTHDASHMEEIPTEPSSPWEEETFFSSPTSRRVVNMSSPLSADKTQSVAEATHASCQAELPDAQHEEQVRVFEEAVKRLTQESSDAKSALELIKQELQSLGFSTGTSTEEDIVIGLRDAFRSARMQLEHILPGETAGGTGEGNYLLKSNLAHLRKLVEAAKADKRTIDRQQQIESALRGQFNATVQKASDLEQRVAVIDSHRTNLIREMEAKDEELEGVKDELEEWAMQAKKYLERITRLEAEAEEQGTSVNRLQSALVTYRDEVTSLESLVIKMENSNTQKDSELSELRGQLQGVVTENQATSRKLTKLRQDVQNSAFDLSALAQPDFKTNVTQRRYRRTDPGTAKTPKSKSTEADFADVNSQPSSKRDGSEQCSGSKRDSGVAMSDESMVVG